MNIKTHKQTKTILWAAQNANQFFTFTDVGFVEALILQDFNI